MNNEDSALIERLRREARATRTVAPAGFRPAVMAALGEAPHTGAAPANIVTFRRLWSAAGVACLLFVSLAGVLKWRETRETQREAALLASDVSAAADYLSLNVGSIAATAGG